MKIYAGLRGNMQKPRIKSRSGNTSEAMAKSMTIPTIKPQANLARALTKFCDPHTSLGLTVKSLAFKQTMKAGDPIALLRNNP